MVLNRTKLFSCDIVPRGQRLPLDSFENPSKFCRKTSTFRISVHFQMALLGEILTKILPVSLKPVCEKQNKSTAGPEPTHVSSSPRGVALCHYAVHTVGLSLNKYSDTSGTVKTLGAIASFRWEEDIFASLSPGRSLDVPSRQFR